MENVNCIDDFIIVKSEEDLPKHYYHENKHVYLCVNRSGKTMICKYNKTAGLVPRWESASNWRDSMSDVVAYRRIRLPQAVLDLCTGAGATNKTVDYIVGLK